MSWNVVLRDTNSELRHEWIQQHIVYPPPPQPELSLVPIKALHCPVALSSIMTKRHGALFVVIVMDKVSVRKHADMADHRMTCMIRSGTKTKTTIRHSLVLSTLSDD